MSKLTYFSLIIYACLAVQVLSDLRVTGPPELKKWWNENPDITYTSLAAFGVIPYGSKILGQLELANPIDACKYITQSNKDFVQHPIIVARRGDCTFMTKAHYAQLAGARMLLMVDNLDENVAQHIMIDKTGHGDSVHIPTALLSKKAGDKLIQELERQAEKTTSEDKKISSISVLYEFEMPKTEEITYNLWLSSSDAQGFKFVKEWKDYEEKLGEHAVMKPHFMNYRTSESPDNCVCGGRYCAPDPDGERKNTGRSVIEEDLRQMCLLKKYSKETWEKYMSSYDTFCLMDGQMNTCGNTMLQFASADVETIRDCINKSYDNPDLDKCTRNDYLEEEREQMLKDSAYMYPSLSINGVFYSGSMFPVRGVFNAICESMSNPPSACGINHSTFTISSSHTSGIVLIGLLIFIVVFVLFVFCCYRRRLRREMHDQVKRDVTIMMEQYSALQDDRTHLQTHDL